MNFSVSVKFLVFCFIIGLFSACNPDSTTDSTAKVKDINMKAKELGLTPPTAKKVAKELTIHGDTRVDNYYWLNQREDQDVIDYLTQENSYLDSIMGSTKAFQGALYEEIIGRFKQDDSSVPYKDNGYYYQRRYEEGKEYPIYTRKKETLEADEEIILNVNVLAEPYDFYNASGVNVSPDNKMVSYGEDTLSRRIYTLLFKDLETGQMLPDRIENTTGYGVWANDNKTIFYAVKDPVTLRPHKIYRHELGTDAAKDVLVFQEEDDTYNAYVWKTKSDKFIIIGSYATLTNEIRYLDADKPNGKFQIFEPRNRAEKVEYYVSHYQDKWFIRTNYEAKNFRLMEAPVNATARDNWKEVVPNRDDVLLEGMDIFSSHLVLSERIKGITQLRVMANDGSSEHYIEFPEDAYVAYTSINPEFDTEILRIGYQSMTTPNSTIDYNMNTKEQQLMKEEEVLGGFDKADYQSERIFAKARDGVQVPISIVYKKGTKLDGSSPLLLYAYGSYGASMEPYFSSTRLSLLNRGFVYAIAHIRGGEEMGRHWYEDGKLLKKKNTFTDYIDCAEHLVAKQYTSKEHLYAMGGSAGGLLMGAVVNMRPDLWNGVIAAVPFVDVVTTMLDESIPLTTGEYDEWGNPNDPEYYSYIKSYSPYDNVEAKAYPTMLVTTGLHDSQVQYWEPAKWVAKLREMKTNDNILLLHTNMEAGHGGASGRFKRHKETAMEYAFLLGLEGIYE